MPGAKKTRRKRQHYVPRLHLKHFVGESPRGMVWTYDMWRERFRPSKPDGTGAQSNFYSVLDEGGVYLDDLDDWLTDVEQKADHPYHRLINGELPVGQERADLCTFVASLFVRSPKIIEENAKLGGILAQIPFQNSLRDRARFEDLMDRFERERGPISVPRDELFEFCRDPSRYTVRVDRVTGLRALKVSDEIQEILYERRWYLVDALGGFFISSDSPVFRQSPAHSDDLRGDGGFRNPLAHVTLPLSPSRMLLITGQELPSTKLAIPAHEVWNLNRARVLGAQSFLYSNVRDQMIQTIARELRGKAGFQVSGGPYAEVEVERRGHNKRD